MRIKTYNPKMTLKQKIRLLLYGNIYSIKSKFKNKKQRIEFLEEILNQLKQYCDKNPKMYGNPVIFDSLLKYQEYKAK